MVLGNPLQRVADEPDVPVSQIVEAVEIVEDLARRRICGQGIDSEVAPRRIFPPIVGERDSRPAAVCRHVTAQGRDLEWVTIANSSDRAMVNTGRNGLDLRLFQAADDLVRR